MNAQKLLPDAVELVAALGPQAHLESERGAIPPVGEVLRTAAADYAFERYSGNLETEEERMPVSVTVMALVFSSAGKARSIFDRVAEAAHLRTQLDGVDVAVETASAPNGLVSYWGYVYREDAIVIVTLDSLDPQHLSVGDLRSLVTVVAARLNRVGSSS